MNGPNSNFSRIRLSQIVRLDSGDDYLDFLAQAGVDCVYLWADGLAARMDEVRALQARLKSRGLYINNAGDYDVAKSANIHLGTERREADIARFADMLRALSDLGIRTTTFTWEPDRVLSSARVPTRGGAMTRHVVQGELESQPFTHGRHYAAEELWGNFAYFMDRILPVCEQTGVRLALHPNDPPAASFHGVDCLITRYEDYKRAFAMAGSPYLGMEFCCGCWLEGGERFGDMFAAIDEFVREGRVFITHFRNITSPLPEFTETFVDDGYGDMLRIMEAFCRADYDGTVILDHTPAMAGGENTAFAFALGYIKASLNAASRKVLGKL